MSHLTAREYHLAREMAERAAAAAAVSNVARTLHLQLAEQHAERARSIGENLKLSNEGS